MSPARGERTDAMQAFFLDAPHGGQRFCLFHPADAPAPRGRILYIHPFAEELNKSRRMAALQARAFAAAGYEVLQIDLLGCGDSSGDFADASWQAWLDDIDLALAWLARRPPAPLWLWGLRAGCLLATQAARRAGLACDFLFWQPVSSGKTALQQFLRLRVAGEALSGKGQGSSMEALRAELAAGRQVEIAGYSLGGALADGLEQARLAPAAQGGRLLWLELGSRPEPVLSPVAEAALQSWQAAGHAVQGLAVEGPAFWASTEIELAPALIAGSLAALPAEVAA